MSFTYDLTTNIGKVRLLIGDTASGSYVFEDAEITAFLDLWGNDLHRSAAQALRSLATDRAKLVTYWSVRGVSINRGEQVRLLMELADKLETATTKVPWEFESVLDRVISAQGADLSNYMDTEADG